MKSSITENEINFYESIKDEIKVVFDVGCARDNTFFEINPQFSIHAFDLLYASQNDKIYYNKTALGNQIGKKIYYTSIGSLMIHDHRKKYSTKINKSRITVPITTIFKYCEEKNINKIDFLKIDTEGWDFEVIKGAGKLIWNIDYIQFEAGWEKYGYKDHIEDIFMYFPKEYNIYSLLGNPPNYVITKKTLPYRFIANGRKK